MIEKEKPLLIHKIYNVQKIKEVIKKRRKCEMDKESD